jgi:hypothetical protein
MTVKEKSLFDFAEMIKFTIEGSHQTSESDIDVRTIEDLAVKYGNAIRYRELEKRRLEILQRTGSTDEFLRTYSSTFRNIPILFDENENEFYANLPTQTMKFGERDSGVWFVSLMQDQRNPFVPTTNFLQADRLFIHTHKRSYRVYDSERIYLNQKDYQPNTELIVRMLVSGLDKPDNEPFIETELEAEIIPQVVQLILNKKAPDLAIDNNPDNR